MTVSSHTGDLPPEPLVPSHVDLRGLEYMPLLGAKLRESDFNLEASDSEFRRAVYLWWAAWNQQPAASLPTSDRALAKLAGFDDEKSSAWRKVRIQALHGFILCSDGRLYHPVLAKQALIAWESRMEQRAERDNTNERKRRERAERSRMFEELRALNIVPAYNVPMKDLRELFTQHVTATETGRVTTPVTVTDTAKTGRDGTGHEKTREPPGRSGADSEGGSPGDLSRDDDEPPPGADVPTAYGLIARALRQAGIEASPHQQRFKTLVDAGATADEFLAMLPAVRAAKVDKPFAYLLGAVEGERKRAAETAKQLHRGAMPIRETDFQRSQRERVEAMTGGRVSSKRPGPTTTEPETFDVEFDPPRLG